MLIYEKKSDCDDINGIGMRILKNENSKMGRTIAELRGGEGNVIMEGEEGR